MTPGRPVEAPHSIPEPDPMGGPLAWRISLPWLAHRNPARRAEVRSRRHAARNHFTPSHSGALNRAAP